MNPFGDPLRRFPPKTSRNCDAYEHPEALAYLAHPKWWVNRAIDQLLGISEDISAHVRAAIGSAHPQCFRIGIVRELPIRRRRRGPGRAGAQSRCAPAGPVNISVLPTLRDPDGDSGSSLVQTVRSSGCSPGGCPVGRCTPAGGSRAAGVQLSAVYRQSDANDATSGVEHGKIPSFHGHSRRFVQISWSTGYSDI
jgi:hypothetical protein